MKNHIFFLSFSFLMLSHSYASTITPGPTIKDPQIIGGVYNSRLNFFDPGIRCVEVNDKEDIRHVFNNEGTVNFNEDGTSTTLQKEFGFGFGFELKPPSGETTGFGMDFLNTFRDQKVNVMSVYKTTIFLGSELLEGPYKLTNEALEISKNNPELFEQICGNEFVTRINKGAVGTVNVKLQAQVIENSNEFDLNWSMGFMDIGSFEASLSKLKKLTELKIKISVSGSQEGGFTARINSIFGSGAGVSSCVIANLAGCTKLLADIVTYFSKDFVTQFDPYFRDASGSGVIDLPVTAAPLSYVTTSYCKLSPKERPSHLKCDRDLDNTAVIKSIDNKKQQILDEMGNLSRYGQESNLVLAPDFFNLLKTYSLRMKKNLKYIRDTKINCLRDKWTCESEMNHLFKRLYPLQPEILSFIKNDERIQFCFKSGKKVEISGLEIRTLTGEDPSKTFKLYGAVNSADSDCFMFNAPELNREEFDGLQIRVKTMGEDIEKCKMRVRKKFSSWANWDLRSVKVKHFKSGRMKTFEGRKIQQKEKCKEDQNSRFYLKWQSLKPLR